MSAAVSSFDWSLTSMFAGAALGLSGCAFSHIVLDAFGAGGVTHGIGAWIGDNLGTAEWGNSLAEYFGFEAGAGCGHGHGSTELASNAPVDHNAAGHVCPADAMNTPSAEDGMTDSTLDILGT